MIRRNVISLVVASVLVVGTSSSLAQTPTPPPGQAPGGQPGPGTEPAQPGETQAAPEQVLGWMHHMNQHEIAAAKLAKQKAKSPEVKKYANQLLKDHQRLDRQVMTQARKMKLDPAQAVIEPAEMQKQQAMMQRLQQLEGASFDREFVQAMMQDHQAAVQKVQTWQAQITNPQLKQLTQKALPSLRMHAERAQKIQGRLPAGS